MFPGDPQVREATRRRPNRPVGRALNSPAQRREEDDDFFGSMGIPPVSSPSTNHTSVVRMSILHG